MRKTEASKVTRCRIPLGGESTISAYNQDPDRTRREEMSKLSSEPTPNISSTEIDEPGHLIVTLATCTFIKYGILYLAERGERYPVFTQEAKIVAWNSNGRW